MGVSILTGTTKRFSRIHNHRPVIFYLKNIKFAVEVPIYKGRVHSKNEANRASRFRDTSEQSFSFCSSFRTQTQKLLYLGNAYFDQAEIWHTCRAIKSEYT